MSPLIDLDELARRENEQTEWKENVGEVDDVVATLCAFANDLQNLGGGYVVCGVKEGKDAHGFPEIVRVGLTAARLKEVEGLVLSRCRERIAPPLAPLVEEVATDDPGRRILVFLQPATGAAHLFRRGSDGAKHFVRVSRATIEARNGLLRDLLVRKGAIEPWDRRPCHEATVEDIDLLVLREALTRMGVPSARPDLLLSATEQLHALVPPLCAAEPLTRVLRPRHFAVLLFGRSPQRFIPGAYAYLSRYPGVDRSTDVAERHELIGSLVEQSLALSRFVGSEATLVMDKTNLEHPNRERYPERALKEALGNALAHRAYDLPEPTRITIFSDRIEFHSPGGLLSGVSIQALRSGRLGPRWRNQTLAWIMMKLNLAQGEGQGVPTIRAQMKAAGNPPPRFEATEASVTCTLFTHRDRRAVARLRATS
jgi:ATP-dependent DNA helicase RecG